LEVFLLSFNIRTDLAIETREMYKKAQKIDDEIPGVETQVDNSDQDILITKVKITTKEAENAMRKSYGKLYNFRSTKT
jgi:spore protease